MSQFLAYQVSEGDDGAYSGALINQSVSELPQGEVLIEVHYSSLNYKDALSASGNRAVTRQFPHVPGIDAAGRVIESSDNKYAAGDKVIVTGYDLGMNTSGGFSQRIRVPSGWVSALPDGLSLKESMIYGTAGLTAGLCIDKLINSGLQPGDGKVLVTGATGGVGIIAISILASLGFEISASTSKDEHREKLIRAGAADVLDRSLFSEKNSKPMGKEEWAGAVDVVGGVTLVNILKTLRRGGSVAACGLVESPVLDATVMPFILRGINLLGVDSVEIPLKSKLDIWNKLSVEWKPKDLEGLCTEINFAQLSDSLDTLLNGNAVGRYILDVASE